MISEVKEFATITGAEQRYIRRSIGVASIDGACLIQQRTAKCLNAIIFMRCASSLNPVLNKDQFSPGH